MAKRERIVPNLSDEQVADFRTPRSIASVKASLPAIQSWYDEIAKWKDACREAAASEKDLPAAPAAPDINDGRLTREEYAAWRDAYNAGDKVAEVYPTYQPVDVQVARDAGMICIISGNKKKNNQKPKNWVDSTMGEWNEGDMLVGPAHRGFGVGQNLRMNHSRDISRCVDDPGENIFRIGAFNYIVGTSDSSAVFLACGSRGGSYEAIDVQRSLLSLAGVKGLSNLVGRINNKPKVVKLLDGIQVAYLAGQVVEWGYLTEDGKEVTPAQLRKMLEGEGKPKLKFSAIADNSDDFKGDLVSEPDLIAAWRTQLGKEGIASLKARSDTEVNAKLVTNSMVQMRVHPDSVNCLKVVSVQLGVVPFAVSDADGNTAQGVAVGHRTNIALNVTVRDARRVVREATVAATAVATAAAEAKAKTESETKTTKTTKTTKAKKAKTKKSKAKKPEATPAPAEEVAEVTDLPAAEEVVTEDASATDEVVETTAEVVESTEPEAVVAAE